MGFEAWIVVLLVIAIITILATTKYSPDLIFLAALGFLLVSGILSPADALAGLTNQGVVTVGILYIVAAALRDSGGMQLFTPQLLGKPKNRWLAQIRIMLPVTALSGFLNNTPVVAMFIPAISDWAKKHNIAVSKYMIPLSYAAIFGGIITLIGTSTNLIVNGMLIQYAKQHNLESLMGGLNMFTIAKIGIPCAVLGIIYILFFSHWLLPEHGSVLSQLHDPREYTVEMIVEPKSPLVGQSIEKMGLRQLRGMYLMEIERGGELIIAVSPQEKLQANDRLVFVGIVDSIVDLQKMRGLVPATNQVFKLQGPRAKRCLIEAVVSNSFPSIGKTIRESHFRTIYNAVVIAVARNGQRIRKKIGDIILQPGDTLLLEALPSFIDQQQNSKNFFLVSKIENSAPIRFEKAWTAILILFVMVILAGSGILSMLKAATLAAGLAVLTGCVSWSNAKRSIDWQVLLVIVAAFGIGKALETTGASYTIAQYLISLAGDNPILVLIVVYGITSLFTELITNNAAAVLVFPIAMASAVNMGVNPMPFIIAIMIGASASFATPIGYQTNLMVFGPGGYRFSDYFRIGLPLNLLFYIITVTFVPLFWHF
ncbi:SLC13 family permease [candidate division KSB1 bacterium]|nr:SLC13 family permease [candidate division KSB1 bacterium]